MDNARLNPADASVSKTFANGDEAHVLKQLLGHVPDIVVQRQPNSPVPQTVRSYGVLLFADVSGFTALCEKYCNSANKKSSGTDQLTTTLNAYLSKIVAAIIAARGDVIKFAGDAILAFWSCSKFEAVQTVHHVLTECLKMQTNYRNYKTADGDTLCMKLGISVGNLDMYHIGAPGFHMLDLAGEAVDDVNAAQNLARSGTVVISPASWDMCNKPFCIARLVGNGFAEVSKMATDLPVDTAPGLSTLQEVILNNQRKSTLVGVTRNAAVARRFQACHPDAEFVRGVSAMHRPNPFTPGKLTTKNEFSGIVPAISPSPSNLSFVSKSSSQKLISDPDVRPTLHYFLRRMPKDKQQFIRTYVQKTVADRIDHGHDASWMSELRQVSVLFINLSPHKNLSQEKKLCMLQNAFDSIYPSLQRFEGSMNKVFMFDKGCTFLCVFGLPHATHEDDAQRALRSAKESYHELKKMDLSQFSIGVTTGVAFCGVVGHLQRHEYTVIGQKVNMAARLMMKFSNAITCDEATRKASGLPDSNFELMPPTPLKGISQPEDIYSIVTDIVDKIDSFCGQHHFMYERSTLIGRKHEMEVLMAEVMAIKEQKKHQASLVAITGSGGMGKTKLMKAMKATAMDLGFRVVSTTAGLVDRNTPFYIAKTLLLRLLGIDKCKNMHEREQLLLSHVTTDEQLELLPLLNDLLVLKFPQTHTTSKLTHQERESHLHRLLLSIIHQTAAESACLFGVDDAHLVDEQSWPFLLDLASDRNTLLVVSLRLGKLKGPHMAAAKALQMPTTISLDLEGLSQKETAELACQLLSTDAIPPDLEKILVEKTNGIPLWCEELISSMIENGLLQVTLDQEVAENQGELSSPSLSSSSSEEEEEEGDDSLAELTPVERPLSDMSKGSAGHHKGRMLAQSTSTIRQGRRKSVVRFARSIRPEDISVPDSVTGMILARFDNLLSDAQMVLKAASVLGTTFSRAMLAAIVPNPMTDQEFNRTIISLASHRLIECQHAAELNDCNSCTESLTEQFQCPCIPHRQSPTRSTSPLSLSSKHSDDTMSFMSECQLLEFVHPYVRDTLYELWTSDQRKKLHEEAALFLESQAHKCKNCGGGGFSMLGTAKPARRKSVQPQGRAFMGTSTRTAIQRNRRRSLVQNRVQPCDEFEPSHSPIEEGEDMEQRAPAETKRFSLVEALLQQQRNNEEDSSSGGLDVSFDLQDCHCDEILSTVYPQLIRHWKEVGNNGKVLHYLMEAAGAAVTTFNNMEALSLLEEARELSSREELATNFTQQDKAELESLMGQALFQSGEVEECLPHFRRSLQLLGSNLPEGKLGGALQLVKVATKQFLHKLFPGAYLATRHGPESQKALDQARCLAHITHAYHLQHRNWQTLMSALQQLNMAEEAEENVHELIEAYSTMLECCHLYGYRSLGKYYQEKALSYCDMVEPDVNDMLTYAHFLNVVLNYSLCEGKMSDALKYGKAAIRISNQLHEVPIKLASMTLLSQAYLAAQKFEHCYDILDQLSSVAEQADDLRARALYECLVFDSVLDTGMKPNCFEEILASAKKCSDEDFFHYDSEERFYMLASLALWHARRNEWTDVKKYMTTAKSLIPKHFETYFAVRAFCRLVECELLLYNAHTKNRQYRKMAKKDLSLLKTLSAKFPVFKPRWHVMKAFAHRIHNNTSKLCKHVTKAKVVAKEQKNSYDYDWADQCQYYWLEADGCSQADILDNNMDFRFPILP